MKKIFYHFLMIVVFVIISLAIYLASLVNLVRYGVIDRGDIFWFTDATMSPTAYIIVAVIGSLIGYFMAKKCWQVVYVDKVYYFGDAKKKK